MGVSTDAILFYGFVWDDNEVEIPEEAAELYGKDEPVLVGYHCSDECSMPYLYVQASEKRAWRGFPKPVDSTDLAVALDWESALAAFKERFDIDTSEAKGPGWFLVSWWG